MGSPGYLFHSQERGAGQPHTALGTGVSGMPATFPPVICLTCKKPFRLMGDAAQEGFEQRSEAYCPHCCCYRICQRITERI